MTDGPLVYLDANPFIYSVEGEPLISEPIQSFFRSLQERPGSAATSELTLAEVLAPSSQGRKRHPDWKRQYLDLIVWSRFINLKPVSRNVLYETANLRATRATAGLKLPDAIHLATALISGCSFFVTGDRRIPVPDGMQRMKPDEASLTEIIESLR
jgi:predicted nucleic acid-binding protein